jgi:CSLREA domain-containing protein
MGASSVSVRSIRRSRERAQELERRREARRIRRAGIAAGAVIGATVVFAPSAMGASFTVDTLADPGNGDGCATTDCSLREAIDDANANSGADTINFQNGLTGEITLTAGRLEVTSPDDLTITGPGEDVVSISGDADSSDTGNGGDSQILYVDAYASVSISGLTLAEGYAASGGPASVGGAIQMEPYSDVALTDATVSDSYAQFGGGIASGGGTLTLTRSDITGNRAEVGAGIFATGLKYGGPPPRSGARSADALAFGAGATRIDDSTIAGNNAGLGGGIFSSGTKYLDPETPPNTAGNPLTVTGTTITGNQAGAGAGSFSKYSDGTISNSRITDNEGDGFVGLASMGSGTTMNIDGTTISGNVGDNQGGGAIGSGKYAQLNVSNSTLTNNSADYAGAIAFRGDFGPNGPSRMYDTPPELGPSRISGTTIAGNQADYDGGAIEAVDIPHGSSFKIANSTISGNHAAVDTDGGDPYEGGGIAFYGYIAGDVAISNSTISGNSAEVGGGISMDVTYQGPSSRRSSGSGGDRSGKGDYVAPGGSFVIKNSTIASNSATDGGGGIYLGYYLPPYEPPQASTLSLSSTIVADNTAGAVPDDLAQTSHTEQPAGFELTNSLVEAPAGATVTQAPAGSSILGADPQLGVLADNGGPTRTQLPAASSPAIDVGLANGLTTDQRGLARTVDSVTANGAGDGTDIGSVELQGNPTHVRDLTRDEVPRKCEGDFEKATLALAGDDTSQTLQGTDGPDILRGFGGDDTVLGLPGDDCMTGDAGEDLLKGAGGADFGDGGAGQDVLSGAGGDDELRGADDDDKLKAAAGDDKAVGGGGEDKVVGGTGDDAVRGRFGADKHYGDDGDDAARGGGGDDRVDGGKGDDALRGGGGDDVIVLGGGSDTVNCGKGEDRVIGAGPNDEIAPNCEDVG